MYPENTFEPKKPRSLKPVIIGGLLLFLSVLLLIIFWPRTTYEQYKLLKVPLDLSNSHAELTGNTIHAFDGMAFYSLDINTGKITPTWSGERLPTPTKVFWADSRGVLLNFGTSFSHTRIDTIIRAGGKRPNDTTRNYTWYLDFATGELTLVNELPVRPDMAIYSETNNGFYYIPDYSQFGSDEDSELLPSNAPLHFFDIAARSNRIVVEDLKITDISHISMCPQSGAICLIGRDIELTETEKLFSIDTAGQKSVGLESNGRLYPTNQPELYISVPAENRGQSTEDVNFTEAEAVLHNLLTNNQIKAGFKVGSGDIIAAFSPSGSFYIIDDTKPNLYLTGWLNEDKIKLTESNLTDANNTRIDFQPVSNVSYGDNGTGLIPSIDGNLFLLSSSPPSIQLPQKLDYQEAETEIKTCANQYAHDTQYLQSSSMFRILFADNDDFATQVKGFSNCVLSSNPQALIGYYYQFAAISPVNGRISSD